MWDAAQRSAITYDELGHVVWVARQVALLADEATIDATLDADRPTVDTDDSPTPLARTYDPQTYVERTAYNRHGEEIRREYPTDPDFGVGSGASPPTVVGRITALTADGGATAEDRFGARVAQDYVDFIRVRPWYEYDFWRELRSLWRETPLIAPGMPRRPSCIRFERLDAGATLVRQGELTTEFFVLLEGLAYAIREDAGRQGRRLETCEPGAWFGEASALSNVPSIFTVRMEQPGEVAILDARLFRRLYDDEIIGAAFAGVVDQRYRETTLRHHLDIAPLFAGLGDADLDELRKLQSHAGDFLVSLEQKEKQRTGIPNLRVAYNSVHGYYIEVTHSHVEKVPADYRRRQTLKNAERYITPELKAFEDKALSAQERALAREKMLYEGLLEKLAGHVPALQRAAAALAETDMLCAFAGHAAQFDYCAPEFTDEQLVEIEGGRHPVVERQVEHFIANDTRLSGARRLLIVTGPNMGGKSTYMRQVALIALLAHCGSFVPARRARLGPLDAIYTRIGAADDIAGGRSTFMVEMTEAAYVLHHATSSSLVLMDEIGRGTSTLDGLALAWAIARHLVEKNRSLALFATHYFEMTQLAADFREVANVHLDAVEHKEKIVFLHNVEEGPASRSYGLEVAGLAGVPGSVIRAARKRLAELEEHGLAAGPQREMFASSASAGHDEPAAEDHAVLARLRELDPDALTPREALDLLYRLRRQLEE